MESEWEESETWSDGEQVYQDDDRCVRIRNKRHARPGEYVRIRSHRSLPNIQIDIDRDIYVDDLYTHGDYRHHYSSHQNHYQDCWPPYSHSDRVWWTTQDQPHSTALSRHQARSHYDNWRRPVLFEPEEAIYHPHQWLEKLEVLEAQVVNNSALPDHPFDEPLRQGHDSLYLQDLIHVLGRVSQNVRNIRLSRYSSHSINILVIERSRPRVARLAAIYHDDVYRFVSYAAHFAEQRGLSSYRWTSHLLRFCNNILYGIGLGLPQLVWHHDWSGHHLRTALLYALRAVAYVLDLGVVSFCGAHLEPFDEVYFRQPANCYTIACGSAGHGGIALTRRRFQCLDGFLDCRPAWVFEAYERCHKEDPKANLYLHTTPEQLANVWGPVWRSEPRLKGGVSRFLVDNGFLVGWFRTPMDPKLVPGEYLCHWTDNREEAAGALGFPRYVNVRYLLIGAGGLVKKNQNCWTTEDEVGTELQDKGYLRRVLGTEKSLWYLDSLCTQIAVAPPGFPLSFGVNGTWKRRKGVTGRNRICTLVSADPLRHLPALRGLHGVEVSGCTFNARRRELRQILVSPAMRELVAGRLEAGSATWRKYEAVLASDYKMVLRTTTFDERRLFTEFIRLSLATLQDLPINSVGRHVDALFVENGLPYRAELPADKLGWLRLFLDDLVSFSALVLEPSCLECQAGRLTCHHPDWRLHYGPPGSVLETSVLLNECALLPPGLKQFKLTGRVTDDMIRHVPAGEELDLGPHGTLRVLAHCSTRQGCVLVVERRVPFKQASRTVWNFFRKALGKMPQMNYHRENLAPSGQPWRSVSVLVVSDRHDKRLAEWLDTLGRT